MEDLFEPWELAELAAAEEEAPWGEMAENYRMEYLRYCMMAASDGYSEQSRKQAAAAAAALRVKLFGPIGR